MILLKSYAPGDMVASQRGSKSAAAGGSAAPADADGAVVTPSNAARIGAAATPSAGQEQQGPPEGALGQPHSCAVHMVESKQRHIGVMENCRSFCVGCEPSHHLSQKISAKTVVPTDVKHMFACAAAADAGPPAAGVQAVA